MIRVKCAEVGKRFGRRWVLRSVSFSMESGAVLCIIGPNGSGKTTLLKIVCTTVLPDEGCCEVGGYDVVRHGPQARRLIGAACWAERSFYHRLTGGGNLEYFGVLAGLSLRQVHARIAELIPLLGLESVINMPYRFYSSGLSRRLSIARALLCRTPVLALDEPTANLDPVWAARIHDLIRSERDRGVCVLMSSHSAHEVESLGDTVIDLGGMRHC